MSKNSCGKAATKKRKRKYILIQLHLGCNMKIDTHCLVVAVPQLPLYMHGSAAK
jgi:hypothetical protein